MKFLRDTDVDWSYWCLDGYKCANQQDETYGIYNSKWDGHRYPHMVQNLKEVGRPKNR